MNKVIEQLHGVCLFYFYLNICFLFTKIVSKNPNKIPKVADWMYGVNIFIHL